jgi:hypothetical protein
VQNPVLLDQDGRRLIAAQFIAQLGFGFALTALPWIVLDRAAGTRCPGSPPPPGTRRTSSSGSSPVPIFRLLGATREAVPASAR